MRVITAAFLFLATGSAARIEVAAGPDAAAVKADLREPFAVAFGRNGDLYVCEYKGHRISRIDKSGRVTVAAGTGTVGDSGDGGPATQAQLNAPHEIVLTRDGQMYIADTFNSRVRKLDLKTGTITTIAGTGQRGFSGDNGRATEAQFNQTFGIALSPDEKRLYVSDLGNRRIRAIELKTGIVTTVAGNGSSGEPADGSRAVEAPLIDPRAVAAGRNGEVYILERRGNALRVVDGKGIIRTLIRPGALKPDLNGPKHLSLDRSGDVFITDTENHLIRRYSVRDGTTTTIAGSGTRGGRITGDDPLKTELNRPHGVAVHPSGALYISDSENNRVLRIAGTRGGR